jgi:hypothetical protein
MNPAELEKAYQEYMHHLDQWAHDGILQVDLPLLHECNILESFDEETEDEDDLTQYFHVIESIDKVTLFNEQFIVWIVPKMQEENPLTFVLIALRDGNDQPHLELVFTTQGVYNTPKFVLKVLQHFLIDMLETEAAIDNIKKKSM